MFAIFLLIVLQLLGESIVQLSGLPVPGAIIGLILLYAMLMWRGEISDEMSRTSGFLLQNLGVLFVPAGVGVIAYLPLLATQWWIIHIVQTVFRWRAVRAFPAGAGDRRDGRAALSTYRADPQIRGCAVQRACYRKRDRDPLQRVADTRSRWQPGVMVVNGPKIGHRSDLNGDFWQDRRAPCSNGSADDLHRDHRGVPRWLRAKGSRC